MNSFIQIFLIGLLFFSNLPHGSVGSKNGIQPENAISRDTTQIRVYIDGMSCMRCVQKIEKKVSAVNGVIKVNVFLEEKYALIDFKNKISSIDAIIAKIEDAGYEVIKHEIIKSKKT